MKKLLKIISCVLVTTPVPLTTISCGGKDSSVSKIQLKTITTLSDLNLSADPAKNFSDMNSQIINATEFKEKPLATGYTIQYWDTPSGGNDITNKPQSNIEIWVTITASSNDPYWEGTTKRIKLQVKENLGQITQLSDLNLSADPSLKFYDLNNSIVNAQEFKNTPLATGYTIQYWDALTGGNDITDEPQSNKNIWVTITAFSNDPHWKGKTTRLAVTILAANFTNITGTEGQITALASNSSGTIYAGSTQAANKGGVYKSDGTNAFTKLTGINESVKQIAVSKTGLVYAITNTKVYKSDGSASFQELTGVSDTLTSITIDSNGNVYIGTTITQNTGNIYKSDGTNAFTILPTWVNQNIKSLTINNNDMLVVATTTKIYKENGTQFEQMLGVTGRINKIIINQTSGTIYAATTQSTYSSIIYKSDGTSAFQKVFEIANIFSFSSIICDDTNDTIYFCLTTTEGMNKLYKSVQEAPYTEIPGITNEIESLTIGSNSSLYVGVNTGTVYKKL